MLKHLNNNYYCGLGSIRIKPSSSEHVNYTVYVYVGLVNHIIGTYPTCHNHILMTSCSVIEKYGFITYRLATGLFFGINPAMLIGVVVVLLYVRLPLTASAMCVSMQFL